MRNQGFPVCFGSHYRVFMLASASLAAMLLAGCQQRPVLRQPDPAPLPQVVAPRFDQLAPVADQGPSIAQLGWEQFFTDAKLKQLIRIGLENNRDLRATALNIERARAQYQIRQSPELPVASTSAGIQLAGTADNSANRLTVGLAQASYEIDFWGRIANLKDAALQTYFATQSAQQTARISLIGQIAQSYLSLAFNREQLRLAQQTLNAQQEGLRLNRKRFEVGIISLIPVTQAQTSVENARLAIENYKTLIQQDENALTLLIGQTVPARRLPNGAPARITSRSRFPVGLPSDLLRNRPDLAQAEYSLKAAGANIAVARAAFYPAISLTGNLGLSSTSLGDLFRSGAFSYGIGPSISLPIFDNGLRTATLQVAQVDQKLALNSYERAIQVAFKDVNDVLATRATLNTRLDAQNKLVQASQTNYRLAQARFRAGLDNYLVVLDAQRSLFAAQQQLINLQQAVLLSQVNLYKALGGGAIEPARVVPGPSAGQIDSRQS